MLSLSQESGKDTSRKEARLKVKLVVYPVHVHFCYCCALLGWSYCGGCISTNGKLVVLIPGGTKACQLQGIGIHCITGLQLQREIEGNFSWGSHVGEH